MQKYEAASQASISNCTYDLRFTTYTEMYYYYYVTTSQIPTSTVHERYGGKSLIMHSRLTTSGSRSDVSQLLEHH